MVVVTLKAEEVSGTLGQWLVGIELKPWVNLIQDEQLSRTFVM